MIPLGRVDRQQLYLGKAGLAWRLNGKSTFARFELKVRRGGIEDLAWRRLNYGWAFVKNHLMRTDEQFMKLAEEHQKYEYQLESLLGKPFLNQNEQVEETVIKKKKLALKDRMQLIIHRHQVQSSAP